MRYDPKNIEPKWQKIWDDKRAFETPRDLATLKTRPKFYVLDMFPYPSGAGLHVGHPEGYTATDVVARLKRATGHYVLHPMGWDAFGLPAERAAVKENIHPAIITKRNIDNFRGQLKRIGFSYDWSRELSTTDVDYYKWTQWIFLQLNKKGLAYLAEVAVNWCPAQGTVLANEEVKDGKYVETGDPVERRTMKQWMLKIPLYAQRLLDDLDGLDWPEGVKEMQRNWIGRSEGAEIDFAIQGSDKTFRVFTTRPDTLFGATYAVLAPEHPLVSAITTSAQKSAVDAYVSAAKQKTDLSRTDLAKEKTGVFTGAFALNPATKKPIPVWVADYVLMTYGTGAIMAVPGHDERDHAFAKAMKLPIEAVVRDPGSHVTGEEWQSDVEACAFVDEGVAIASENDEVTLSGLGTKQAKERMIQWLEQKKLGTRRVQFKLRDWLFSRQRYWGEPFPILHADDGEVIALDDAKLPVELPKIDEFKPTDDGKPPLGRASPDWLRVKLPDGRMATRELNTMPQWAGSCWYYLRFIDPKNSAALVDKELEKHWMPVDLYVGGVEHAVLHLLYARFWHKVLFDIGVVSTKEPFQKLFNQGMILAYSYKDANGKYHGPHEVEERAVVENGKEVPHHFLKSTGERVVTQIEKMSKSKLNVVNPDDVVRDYGADALRLYELFMGPLEQVKPWQMAGVEGVSRFLARVWRLVVDEESNTVSKKLTDAASSTEPALEKQLHKTIKKVQEDTEGLRFNTAISAMMEFVNEATGAKTLPKSIALTFVKVLSPYAPHVAEELWQRLGNASLVSLEAWPKFDAALVAEDTVTIGVQVGGKTRSEITVRKTDDDAAVTKVALADATVLKFTEGKQPKKVIVPRDKSGAPKLVNVVV